MPMYWKPAARAVAGWKMLRRSTRTSPAIFAFAVSRSRRAELVPFRDHRQNVRVGDGFERAVAPHDAGQKRLGLLAPLRIEHAHRRAPLLEHGHDN